MVTERTVGELTPLLVNVTWYCEYRPLDETAWLADTPAVPTNDVQLPSGVGVLPLRTATELVVPTGTV
jgi:hypothetical protein